MIGVGRVPATFGGPRQDARAVLESDVTFEAQQIAEVRCQLAAIAVERYRRDHAEQLPDALTALVPAYLPAVPIDPFTGMPLHMLKEGREYVVYSVNSDRQDDVGQLSESGVGRFGPDLGVRIRSR